MQIINLFVDVGAAGRAGDAGVFADSALQKSLTINSLDLPDVVALQGISTKISHHVVGDDAFPLNARMMKPYPYRNLEKEKRIFNYRLSRARRVVENAFGILAHRKLSPEKVTDIIFAACCLHNLMVEKKQSKLYISCGPGECRSYIGKRNMEKQPSFEQHTTNHPPQCTKRCQIPKGTFDKLL